jgi:hypothetical protein
MKTCRQHGGEVGSADGGMRARRPANVGSPCLIGLLTSQAAAVLLRH